MTYQQMLVDVLSEAFPQVTTDTASFVLHGNHAPVQVVATEADIASHAQSLAKDGLLALGPVHHDATGLTAGVGLLAIHIEELVASDLTVTQVEVTPTELLPHRRE